MKNRNLNSGSDCVGVNLNRNFNVDWGFQDSEIFDCADNFAGPSANSELETDAISHEMDKLADQIAAYVTLQSGGQSILYPYWYTG
jgi:hypothetical protein